MFAMISTSSTVKPRKVAMFNEIVRVFMMLPGIDEIADVVEDGREFQPFPFPLPESMQRFRLIEQADSQPSHMKRVHLRGMTAASQRQDVALADVRDIAFSLNPFPMPLNEIKNQSLADRLVANGEFILLNNSSRMRRTIVAGSRVSTRLGSKPGMASRVFKLESGQQLFDPRNFL